MVELIAVANPLAYQSEKRITAIKSFIAQTGLRSYVIRWYLPTDRFRQTCKLQVEYFVKII